MYLNEVKGMDIIMEVGIYPEYLYHYTNLDSLASILKNKKIRFSPLNVLDDMEEAILGNFSSFAKYVFVSSWTCDKEENIPFWNMYTRNMHGVRIKLASLPFKKYIYKSHEGISGTDNIDVYMPLEEMSGKDYSIFPMSKNLFFFKVEYTEDTNKLYPKILSQKGDEFIITTKLVGTCKRQAWDFQKEWRYKLICFPMELDDIRNNTNILMKRMSESYNLPFNYIDLEISDDAFFNLEIMSGPKMSEGEKECLKAIVEKYCPTAKIIESTLKIR